MAICWQTSRVDGPQGRTKRLGQRRRRCGVMVSVFSVNAMRIGGDKLPVTGVSRVRNRGEQHCVKLQALCVYDTRKKVSCSLLFP